MDPEELIRKNEEYIEEVALHFESIVFSATKKIMEESNYKSLQAVSETIYYKLNIHGNSQLPVPYLVRAILARINSRGNLTVVKFDPDRGKHTHAINPGHSNTFLLIPTQNLWKTGRDIPICVDEGRSVGDKSSVVFSSANGRMLNRTESLIRKEPLISSAVEVSYRESGISTEGGSNRVQGIRTEVDRGIIDLMGEDLRQMDKVINKTRGDTEGFSQ